MKKVDKQERKPSKVPRPSSWIQMYDTYPPKEKQSIHTGSKYALFLYNCSRHRLKNHYIFLVKTPRVPSRHSEMGKRGQTLTFTLHNSATQTQLSTISITSHHLFTTNSSVFNNKIPTQSPFRVRIELHEH